MEDASRYERLIKPAVIILLVVITVVSFVIRNGDRDVIALEQGALTSGGGIAAEEGGGAAGGENDAAGGQGGASEAVYVDVSGAVLKPGVVKLESGARVFQAIEEAGGLKSDAVTVYMNLAAVLCDGDKIYVPRESEIYDDGEKTPGSGENVTDSGAGTVTGQSGAAASEGAGAPGSSGSSDTSSGSAPETSTPALDSRTYTGVTSIIGGAETDTLGGAPPASITGHGSSSDPDGRININTADSEALQTVTGIGPSTAQKIIDYRNANGPYASVSELTNIDGIGEKTLSKYADRLCV